LKICLLVEDYGPPWDEGYKNFAKYTAEMLGKMCLNADVIRSVEFSPDRVDDYDLIHNFNHKIRVGSLVRWKAFCPVIKEFAKLDIEGILDYFDLLPTVIKSNFILTTTEYLRRDIARLFPWKKIECLPIPFPVDSFVPYDKSASRQSLGLDLHYDEKLVVYTGRINKHRNLDLFFAASTLFAERCKFALAISHQIPSNLVIPRNIIIIRNVSEVRKLYSAADLLVYPTKRRGSIEPPLTILEAMSTGCVVAAMRNPITSDVISDGYNGFLFSDLSDLSQIIEKMIQKEKIFDAIKGHAMQSIRTRYDLEAISRQYLDFYKKVQNR
jgi:glycosyltransferase involved in cell wall biosynthesis